MIEGVDGLLFGLWDRKGVGLDLVKGGVRV